MQANRTLTIIVLAVTLMVVVMACAVTLTVADIANREKYTTNPGWSVPAREALSINTTDLTGDQQRDIFVQDAAGIKILDGQGQPILEKPLPQPLASTMGDLNGDGVTDIVAYTWNGDRPNVLAFTGLDQTLWEQQPAGLAQPGRAVSIDFDQDGRSEIVVGDQNGRLAALSAGGEALWQYSLPAGASLRGLDDVPLVESDLVAAGDERGLVVILNRQGREMWQTTAEGGLRRLRAFPLGGPLDGHVMVGSVNGKLTAHQGASGQLVWQANLG